MAQPSVKRSFLQRIFGIPATGLPGDEAAWSFESGVVTVDLERMPEVADPESGVRLEGKGLPVRLLIVRDRDGALHAFRNRCRHFFRRLDPVPGSAAVQCCSVSKSTYDLDGKVISGPARGQLHKYTVEQEGTALRIRIE